MMPPRMKSCPACGLVFPDESNFCFLSGDTLQPMEDPLVGTTIAGRFRIEGLGHDGPWATVYVARERLLDEPCTVKIFKGTLDENQRARFVDALAKARRASHPNVAPIVGGGIDEEGRAHVVHVRPSGVQTLAEVIAKRPLDTAQALGVVVQVLKALGRIHDFGGTHGQLRPSNVLHGPPGHVALIDVGLGRLVVRDPWDDDPTSLEAQHYQAPEISSGQRTTPQADLYAAAVLAHQLLSGRRPIEAEDVRALRDELAEIAGPQTAPKLAPPFQAWLGRMLARTPADRPANAHQALDELLAACEEAKATPAADPGAPAPATADLTLDRAFARWERYRAIFSRMLEMGFPNGAPETTRSTLATIAGRAEDLAEIGRKAIFEHQNLRDVRVRAAEGRGGIADQMTELNDSAREIRKELEPLLIAADRHGEKAQAFPAQALEQHREVLRWEGRSGFAEPYRELAEAYKGLGATIEKWWSVRSAQLACEKDAADKNEELRRIEAQLDELREALRIHEANLEAEIGAIEETLSALGRQADTIETDLLELASRFSAPLRSKPELGGCFRELAEA